MFYTSDHYFYYIERYKFFKCDNGFYISFDPVNESSTIEPDDNDFILCSDVKGCFL